MSPQTRRWLEKLQVQVAVAAAAIVAWFAVWRLVRPWDPHAGLAFLPSGDFARLAVFAGMVWAIAAGCALLTLSARIEGALVAALAAPAALGLRGGGMDALLKYAQKDLHATFVLLSAEVLMMGGVFLGTLAVVHLVRAVGRRLLPRWAWPHAGEAEADPPKDGSSGGGSRPQPSRAPAGQNPIRKLVANVRRRSQSGRTALWHLAGCLVMELAVAMIVLVLTFRSIDPGQIAFALAASFFVAALTAHSVFPVRSAAPFWLGPLLMGTAVLAMGGLVGSGSGPEWYGALMVAHGMPLRGALPAQWLGLGCGGALAGVWLSRRLQDRQQTEAD